MHSFHEVDSILSLDLRDYGTSFTAVYMDPPLLLPGEEPSPGKIHVDDLVSFWKTSLHEQNSLTMTHIHIGYSKRFWRGSKRISIHLDRKGMVTKDCQDRIRMGIQIRGKLLLDQEEYQ